MMQFLYVMDPMCGWCYGFQPELAQFLTPLKAAPDSIAMRWVMGGLAPDTDQPMPDDLRKTIAAYWHEIEQKSQVSFNHDFWCLNTPYRSTYPACRAVITAESLMPNSAEKMVKAIQSAYYLEAKNPSLHSTLLNCAVACGFAENQFDEVLKSEQTEQQFQQHLGMAHHLQVRGFPALFYIDEENRAYPLTLGFCTAGELVERLQQVLSATS